jgi:tRNA 2-thiouridine synthesizing protein B
MATLHIIRSSGYSSNALAQCLSMLLPQDNILLMDDGCYNLSHALLLKALKDDPELTAYVVSEHASARAQSSSHSDFILTTLIEVVTLLFKHDNSITWS